MEPSLWLVLAGLLILPVISGFFALAEASLLALGKFQARQLAERSQLAGVLARNLLESPSELIATLQLGSSLATFALVALALWPVLIGKWPLLITITWLMLLVTACETLPKIAGARNPEKWSLRVAPTVAVFQKMTRWISMPVEWLTQWLISVTVPHTVKPQRGLSDDEYKELLEMAHEQGALARSERDIILQIISLDRKTAGDVMKPRTQIAAVSDDASIEEMIAAARKYKYRRLAIYDETLDTIVGILNTRKLLLNPGIDLSEVIDFPSNVPESMNLLQLLKSLQRQQRGLAIVLDEFGGTAGLVTIEDILEEVVGEIRDRDELPAFLIEKLGEGRWKLTGGVPIETFREQYPEIGEVDEVETMGGLMVHLFEVVPAAGQSVVFRNLRLTAQHTDERRVRELLAEAVKNK